MIPVDTGVLDFDQFNHPDPFYYPGYMWIWNDRLSREQITAQIQDMADHHALTPMVVPEPKAFRPRNMPTRLEPEYLSPEYFTLYRFMVEAATEEKMNVWLYDEGGWPSGSVCGQLVKQHPELIKQKLTRRRLFAWKGKTISIPHNSLGACLYQGSKFVEFLPPGHRKKIGISSPRVVLFNVRRGGGRYPDLLNPKTTQEFIHMTHDLYQQSMGDYFGNTITLMFTDEPLVAAKPPWTGDLAEAFKVEKGYDVFPQLPALFGGKSLAAQQFRIDFFDWWSKRFASAYFGQLQEWCHDNQILAGGHLDDEDDTIGAARRGYGHVLRPFRKMDVPGVDVISRQIWPGKKNHFYPKYASSVAHQDGKRWALTESFAVYGSGITPPQMKWILDYQFVRGINLVDIAGYQYSIRDWFTGGGRPAFGPHHPLWGSMDVLHTYVARLCYMLSTGTPIVPTAVYYPVRDLWAKGESLKVIKTVQDKIATHLLASQCDFDFIDDDILESEDAIAQDGLLSVGPMRYETICVSRTHWISPKSLQTLAKFAQAGGRVLWCDEHPVLYSVPQWIPPKEFQLINVDNLPAHVTPIMKLDPPNSHIRVCKRQLIGGNLYFITSEQGDPYDGYIEFFEAGYPVLIDPELGQWFDLATEQTSPDTQRITVHFAFAGSLCVFFSMEKIAALAPWHQPDFANPLYIIQPRVAARKIRASSIVKSGIEIQSFPSDPPYTPVPLGDWRKWAGKGFSGEVEYRIEFSCPVEVQDAAQFLDLGEVKYACQVELNGEPLGKKLWVPFVVPIPGKLRAGENLLLVKVSNTLANQYMTQNPSKYWSFLKLGPYHRTARRYERQSRSSGLYGPLAILR